MVIYLDFQAFRVNNEIIVKELTILNQNFQFSHYIFSKPCDYIMLTDKDKKQVEWLKKHHHGLDWSDGYISYEKLDDILKKEINDVVCVKGNEKKKFLEKRLFYSVNIEDFLPGYRISNLSDGLCCKSHQGVCSMRNVFYMKYYCELNNFKLEKKC